MSARTRRKRRAKAARQLTFGPEFEAPPEPAVGVCGRCHHRKPLIARLGVCVRCFARFGAI